MNNLPKLPFLALSASTLLPVSLAQAQRALPATPPDSTVTRDGIFTRVRTKTPWVIEWKKREAQTWIYGVNDSKTYHLEEFPAPPEPARKYPDTVRLDAPSMWLARWDAAAKTGFWLQNAPGSNLAVSDKGERIVVTIPAGATVVLAPLTSKVEKGFDLAQQAIEPIRWDGLEGSWRGLTIRVEDRNRNGQPDTLGDRWQIFNGDKRTLVMSFGTKAQDPLQEGAFCLIHTDLNKNGTVDDDEIERPTYKLVDRSGDGQFFAGALLQGGRLEQDEYYYNLAGAPDGTLWTDRVRALDLDGDGDQDVTERLNMIDYFARGEGGAAGTAANKQGILMNYSDRPFSDVLEINAAKGQIIQNPIRYDQYFFADNACASTAYAIDENNVWHPYEEHQEYEGFHAGDAELHLWTWAGGLNRLIYGGLGGAGKWKLGVDFSPAQEENPPAHLCRWRTPYGQELKQMSYLAPQKWDGKKLVGQVRKGGHWDYVQPSPISWALRQKWDSRTVIEPNDVPGEQAFEAYLDGISPRSRTEFSSFGATTFRFYYSPLLGGLHHRGALFGQTANGALLYADRDGDGVMDSYAYDADGDNRFARRLWYDRKSGRVTLFESGKISTWNARYDFPETLAAPENFGALDTLFRRGNGDKALVTMPPPATATAQSVSFVAPVVALDGWHGDAAIASWKSQTQENGVSFVGPALALSRANLTTLDQEFSAESLRGINVVLVPSLAREVTRAERAALKAWVAGGGKLVLAPGAVSAEELARFSALAREFGADFSAPNVALDFRKMRIPDNGNIVGDTIGERNPTALNRRSAFSGRAPWLHGIEYLAAAGSSVAAPQIMLAHGSQNLIGRAPDGAGELLVVGGALLSNRFAQPPHDKYILRPGEPHRDNFVLAQRVLASLLGFEATPRLQRAPEKPLDTKIKPRWKQETVENSALKMQVYPQIGGRILWLGRRDSGVNQLRVEDADYLAGPPNDIGPFAYGRNYGGLWDVGAPTWPGLHLWDKTYNLQRQSSAQGERLLASSHADGVRVERAMTLPANQAALDIAVTQTNISPLAKRLMIREQVEFRAGAGGTSIYWPNGDKIERQTYEPGKEEGRGFLNFKGDWAASCDHAHSEIILHRIRPEAAAPRLFYWNGGLGRENENWRTKEVAPDNHGFYSLQFWFPPVVAVPKASTRSSLRLEILSGLSDLDLVGENYAAQLLLSKSVLQAGEKLTIMPRVASADATLALGCKVTILPDVERTFEPVIAAVAGRARQWTWQVDTTNWAKGEHLVTLTGPDGKTAAKKVVVE